jgi:2-oxoglutarate dehydrogenase E2 component (dihydrolipoamide succinyltransferase)
MDPSEEPNNPTPNRIPITVPEFSESITEGSLGSWYKAIGDTVREGENLVDIETDKVTLDIPAPADGRLTAIVHDAGSDVRAGHTIGYLEREPAAGANEASRAEAPEPQEPTAPPSGEAGEPTAPPAGPAARRVLQQAGLDPQTVTGSGPGGRITKDDAVSAAQRVADQAAATARPEQPSHGFAEGGAADPPPNHRPEERVPMTRLRARIADRLVEVQRQAAILTTFNEVNMAPVQTLRRQYRGRFEEVHGVKLGLMSFFVRAVIEALKRYPVVNASIDGHDVVYHGYFDIGIAVSAPRGLVVPVIRNADRLGLAGIEQRVAAFRDKAESGTLELSDLEGGTFTITNGGVFGSMLSTPIINPPQSAVLGMHRIQDRPVAEDGQVVIRPVMYLALSYDHRLIDGREAVSCLAAIKDYLEDPARMVLGV